MEKILLDYSEYERLKGIEKSFHELKSRHDHENKSGASALTQVGKGNVPTGFLQKVAVTEENGPSKQTILENPTAPVVFTSKPDTSSKVNREGSPQKAVSAVSPLTRPEHPAATNTEVPKEWWVLD